MKTSWLIISFLLVAIVAPATTIIIYITPTFVIMAVDSKAVYTDLRTNRQTTKNASKIYKTGAVYFSVAGLNGNAVRNLNIAKLVHEQLSHTKNLVDATNATKVTVKAALTKYLTQQKISNYNQFKKNITEDTYITSIGLIAMIDSIPYAQILGFKVTDGKYLKITIDEEVYDTRTNKDGVYYLGTSSAIDGYLNNLKSNNLAPADFVENLMQTQIDATPQLVGPPVNMIELTKSGAQWLKRNGNIPVQF